MANDKGVSIDRDFARFGNKSYAINKINSVEVRQRQPYGQGAAFGWAVLALIFVMVGAEGLKKAESGLGYIVLAAIFGFLAYRAWVKSRIVEYQLFLMTSSSEAQAIASQDGGYISALRDRIERAMAGQLIG